MRLRSHRVKRARGMEASCLLVEMSKSRGGQGKQFIVVREEPEFNQFSYIR